MHKLRVAWLVAGLGTIGCADYTSSIKADAPLHPGSAYLYGRFRMENVAQGDAWRAGDQAMGLEFHCHDGATYAFGSKDTRDVQVLEIAPSKCWLVRAIFDLSGGRYSVQAAPEAQRSLDFSPDVHTTSATTSPRGSSRSIAGYSSSIEAGSG